MIQILKHIPYSNILISGMRQHSLFYCYIRTSVNRWFKMPILGKTSEASNCVTRPGNTSVVHCGESAVTECLSVSALGICGDTPPWWASPLVLVVQGIHQYDPTGSVDGPSRFVGSSPQIGRRMIGSTANCQSTKSHPKCQYCRVSGGQPPTAKFLLTFEENQTDHCYRR